MAGLYIHIPFCESRCIYCGFYSTTSLTMQESYVNALCQEMELRPLDSIIDTDEPIETIYLGGGTPSLLTKSHLQQLFQSIQENYLQNHGDKDHPFKGMEITMECNPDDVTEAFCKDLKTLPVNRISMGAQTFSNERLHFLHRRHTAEEVKIAIERLREVGISNISIDLMFGFPYETLADWRKDIREALALHVEHISAYSLMYEEGTALYKKLAQGKIKEIDEEVSLDMYTLLCDALKEAGYEHYEISNFALPGYRSRHNSSYWKEIPYLGIGAAAHSYKRTKHEISRSWNIANVKEYIHSIDQGILPSEKETLDLKTRYNDLIATALRTSEGIDIDHLREEFGEEITQHFLQEAQLKIQQGLMEEQAPSLHPGKSHQSIRLSKKGIYISDGIMEDFMIV